LRAKVRVASLKAATSRHRGAPAAASAHSARDRGSYRRAFLVATREEARLLRLDIQLEPARRAVAVLRNAAADHLRCTERCFVLLSPQHDDHVGILFCRATFAKRGELRLVARIPGGPR